MNPPAETQAELSARQGRLEGLLQALDQRIDRLQERVGGMEVVVGSFKSSLDTLGAKVTRVLDFFYSNGKGTPSFETRFALLESEVRREIDTKERLKWLLVGIATSGGALLVWRIVTDAIERGVAGG